MIPQIMFCLSSAENDCFWGLINCSRWIFWWTTPLKPSWPLLTQASGRSAPDFVPPRVENCYVSHSQLKLISGFCSFASCGVKQYYINFNPKGIVETSPHMEKDSAVIIPKLSAEAAYGIIREINQRVSSKSRPTWVNKS